MLKKGGARGTHHGGSKQRKPFKGIEMCASGTSEGLPGSGIEFGFQGLEVGAGDDVGGSVVGGSHDPRELVHVRWEG